MTRPSRTTLICIFVSKRRSSHNPWPFYHGRRLSFSSPSSSHIPQPLICLFFSCSCRSFYFALATLSLIDQLLTTRCPFLTVDFLHRAPSVCLLRDRYSYAVHYSDQTCLAWTPFCSPAFEQNETLLAVDRVIDRRWMLCMNACMHCMRHRPLGRATGTRRTEFFQTQRAYRPLFSRQGYPDCMKLACAILTRPGSVRVLV